MQDQGDEVFVEREIKRFVPISSRKVLKRASDHLNLNILKGQKKPQNGSNALIQLKIFIFLFILAPVVHCVHFLTVQVSHFRVEMFQQLPASE